MQRYLAIFIVELYLMMCCMLSLNTCMHTNICMPSSMYRIGAHIFERHIYIYIYLSMYIFTDLYLNCSRYVKVLVKVPFCAFLVWSMGISVLDSIVPEDLDIQGWWGLGGK
jgi:hypothetical protein